MSLMLLPCRSIWPTPERRSIWPGRRAAIADAISQLGSLLDSLGGILWLPNQHNYVLTTDTAVAPVGDPVGYVGSHRQNLPENYVKNSMMVGAGAGVLPTGWAHGGLTAVGITATIDGVGTDSDGTYLQFSLAGTASNNGTIFIFIGGAAPSGNHPSAKQHQLWSACLKYKGVSGTQRGMAVVIREIAAGGFGSFTSSGNLIPTNGVSAVQKHTRVLTDAATSHVAMYFQFSIGTGQVWDSVVRIYAPQLERGKPTAFTPTYGEAISRGVNFEPAWNNTTPQNPILGVDADGKSILTFDGLNDFFRTGIQTPEAGYIAGVWQGSSNSKGMFSSTAAAGGHAGARFNRNFEGYGAVHRYDGTTNSTVLTTALLGDSKFVMDGHFSAANATVRRNGTAEGTQVVARVTTSANYFRIGADGNGGDLQGNYWPGRMLAQLFIPGARPGATIEAEIRRLLAEICTVEGPFPYTKFAFTEGSGVTITPAGNLDPAWPTFTLNGTTTGVWANVGDLTIHSAGNRTTRIFGNAAIDDMMRLDDLTGEFKVKFFAVHIKRNTGTTPVSAAERIFQYGDQGSSSTNPDGGWVARINFGGVAPFLTRSVSFAIHTPWRGVTKPGSQSDDSFPDPLFTTPVYSDAEWQAGISFLFAVDNSVTPYRASVYANGVLVGHDAQPDLNYVLPGISTNGPGNDSTSNGLTLFAQSTNQGTAPLKDAILSPIYIGRTKSAAHVAEIAARLHANRYRGNPYE